MRDLNLISLTGEVLADVEVRRLSDGSPYGETVLGWGEDQQVEVLLLGDRYTPHGRWRQGWQVALTGRLEYHEDRRVVYVEAHAGQVIQFPRRWQAQSEVALVGRLTHPPQQRGSSAQRAANGAGPCELRLAVKREDGSAVYLTVVCFGGAAGYALERLDKGWRVAVQGRLRCSPGKRRHAGQTFREVEAHLVQDLGAPKGAADGQQGERRREEARN